MQAYLLSLLITALVGTLVGLLCPDGGISKYVRLLSSLALICVLISPVKGAVESVRDFFANGITLPDADTENREELFDRFEAATDEASKSYFTQALTQLLETQFSMPTGTVRCDVAWNKKGEELIPNRVTVFLSKSSIWKDPHAIEDFVTSLLNCECITAIE